MAEPVWVSRTVAQLPRVGSRVTDEAAAGLSARGADVLDLHAHPVRALPEHVLDAVMAAARANQTAPSRGLPVLRNGIAARLGTEVGRFIDPDTDVLVTAGAMQALDLVLGAILSPGDEVLTPAPCFFMGGIVERYGARLATVSTQADDGFAIDWEVLERAITPATRVLLIITPGNPTGYVLSAGDVASLADLANRRGLLVVSDESYDRLVYDGRRHLSPYAAPALAGRVALIRSFTKSFAMPGWRVGYVVGPPPLIDASLKLLEWTSLYGSAVPQAAAAAALDGPRAWLDGITDEFQARRDRVRAALDALGLPTVCPAGGPFLFPDVTARCDQSDVVVAEWLLREYGLPVVAGSTLRGPGYLRLPLGSDLATLDALIARLGQAFSVPARVAAAA